MTCGWDRVEVKTQGGASARQAQSSVLLQQCVPSNVRRLAPLTKHTEFEGLVSRT